MKKRILPIVVAATLLLGSCGSAMAAPVPTLISATPELYVEQAQNPVPELYVADACKYQGVVKEISTVDGSISSVLIEQKSGTINGNPNLLFHLNSDTKINTEDINDLKQGQVIEVFYSGIVTASIPGQATAIAVNILDQTEKQLTATFMGNIKEVTKNDSGLSLLINGQNFFDGKVYKDEIVFHIGNSTVVTNGKLEALEAGKTVAITFSGALTRSIPPQGSAIEITLLEGDALKTIVNGKLLDTTPKPYIKDGRVMVPVRDVFESLGATVTWNNEERSVLATREGVEIKLFIDKDTAFVNGQSIKLDVPAEIEADTSKTMVPLRFVAESLGQNVHWDDFTRTVIVN
ncbi:MAG: stalk domain-containing protein [Bacillota bacterium]|nr:stalk domain-containing protein [Bacillota bacterium]